MTQEKKGNNFTVGLISGMAIVVVLGLAVYGVWSLVQKPEEAESQVAGESQEQQEQMPDKVSMIIEEGDHVLGNPEGKVKVFEFSDFQCPYCQTFHEVMHQIVEEYPNDVAWVYKQFPISSHPLGMPGAIATECAGEQGKFWEMSDKIFDNAGQMDENSYRVFASELGLDVEVFESCQEKNPHASKIEADYQMGISSGVQGTPSSFVNGDIIPGALPYESMKQIVEQLLAS